ncbi:hypothetical protein ABTZ99_15655 [Actinosynnema sp. NPDC002837]
MSWARGRIATSVRMDVGDGVPVDLRGGLDDQAFLAIGDGIEITLRESHVRALRDQATAALGDMALVEAADRVVDAVYNAGAQARTAAVLAREKAETAQRAGAGDQATVAFEAARHAAEAAEQAQVAVQAAAEAMRFADEAAETAMAAARAATQEPPGQDAGQPARLV